MKIFILTFLFFASCNVIEDKTSVDRDFYGNSGGNNYDYDGMLQVNSLVANDASGNDYGYDITKDASGNYYIVGTTESSLGGTLSGSRDIFVMKLNSYGQLDSQFGDGDGIDNDGILQINTNVIAGASSGEYAKSILYHSGNLYIGGFTAGTLGRANLGGDDIVVIKVDATHGTLDSVFGDGDGTVNDGVLQIGSASTDQLIDIETEGAGNIYILGETQGAMSGANGGSRDIVVAKFDLTSGNLDGTFGDGDGNDNDGILQMNATYVADASGNDYPSELYIQSSTIIYILGYTHSGMGGTNSGTSDMFLAKMDITNSTLDATFGDGDGSDNDGIVQFNNNVVTNATGTEIARDLAFNGTDIYIAGTTSSALTSSASGGSDMVVFKIENTDGVLDTAFGDNDGSDNDGVLQFNSTLTPNANSNDVLRSIEHDGGNLYLVGHTTGAIGGFNSGSEDILIMRVDATDGNLDTALGNNDGQDTDGILHLNNNIVNDATGYDISYHIFFDTTDSFLMVGHTAGYIGGFNDGGADTLIMKYDFAYYEFDSDFGGDDGN